MKELMIIGAGPVGLYAAFTAGMRKIDAVVIESAQTVGGQLNLYLEKIIYDIPGFNGITAKDLIDKLYEQYKTYEQSVPLRLNETVLSIKKKEDYFIVTTDKDTIEVKRILMTHGGGKFTPRKVTGLEADNLKYNVDNLNSYKDKKVAIFGGGDSAVDWANLINNIAKNVYLIHRRTEFRAHLSSLEMFEQNGGKILAPYTLKDQVIEHSRVIGLTVEEINTKASIDIDVDEVLVFYGLIQTKTSYQDWLVEAERGLILVDTKMETSVKGIFACGNGIYYEGKQKMITTGFGETITALCEINFQLHPEQKVPQYSSMMKK